jgi:hypothetical protein
MLAEIRTRGGSGSEGFRVIYWESQYSKWPDTDLLKPEYMTPQMFGWALAQLAWFRGEDRPEWARHLNSAARANLKQGLRYLMATKDSWYRALSLRHGRKRGKPDAAEIDESI